MNNSSPQSWKKIKLGELGETFNGLTGKNKEDFGAGAPYITYKNIFSNHKIKMDNFDYCKILPNEKQNKVQIGDFFFTTSSETPNEVGMGAVLLEKPNELYLNSFCFGFRLKNYDHLLPEFGAYLVRGNKFRKEMQFLAQGSTRYNISKSSVLDIVLSLPSILEQKKIAELLDKIDQVIELAKSEIQKIKNLKKGMMQELLTKGVGHDKFKISPSGKIPEGWVCGDLGTFVKFSQGIQVDVEDQFSEAKENRVRFLRIVDYTQSTSDLRYIRADAAKKGLVSKDDIVMVRYGASTGFIGRGLIGAIANNMFTIEPNSKIL
ncbi:MAG: restriction endonuclease subunit S, partial [Pseudobdellovibrio sp.]